ncbi:MAG: hypothetical protein JO019_02850 [Candidatus Kaiserbacteria bacterium]|nr:hypothetical protein [Candidatus Kaiserbacteria bacterium]
MTRFVKTAVTGVFLLQAFIPTATAMGESVKEKPDATAQTSYTVSMTGYNAVTGQTDSTPDKAAIGVYTDPDVVAARSMDLADELPWGTVIEVAASSSPSCGIDLVQKQIGLRVIADSMHPRKKNQIDILLDSKNKVSVNGKKINPAVALGFCKHVSIKVVGRISTSEMPKNQEELKLALETRSIATPQTLAVSK